MLACCVQGTRQCTMIIRYQPSPIAMPPSPWNFPERRTCPLRYLVSLHMLLAISSDGWAASSAFFRHKCLSMDVEEGVNNKKKVLARDYRGRPMESKRLHDVMGNSLAIFILSSSGKNQPWARSTRSCLVRISVSQRRRRARTKPSSASLSSWRSRWSCQPAISLGST